MTIKVLPEEVILKIAAGEVIERPVSVVKEILENSLDSGADNILVELESENDTFSIRILDNGKGMSKEDLKVCYLRHATSKISSADDLFNINSLGFRGEALASIAAISKTEIKSKQESSEANKILIEGGVEKEFSSAAFPYEKGTEVKVSNLFYNTPARLAFLKTPATEVRLVTELISQYVFAKENVAFKLIINGKTTIVSPSGTLKERFYNIYGKDAERTLEINEENIKGIISKPQLSRKSRSDQFFFVNGRLVKSRIAYVAISNAYKGYLNTWEHPVAILKVEVDQKSIDVNVHPTKQEIKFKNEQEIYRLIYHSIKKVILSQDLTKEIKVEDVQKVMSPKETIVMSKIEEGEQTILRDGEVAKQSSLSFVSFDENANYRIVGIFNKEFIVAEKLSPEPHLIVVDFHAAAEIVNYERLTKQYESHEMPTQSFIQPEVLETNQVQLILENKDSIKQLGFDIDEFGEDGLILRSSPILFGKPLDKSVIFDILEELQEGKKPLADMKDKIITRMACRASEKAGDDLTLVQAKVILDNLFGLEGNKYNCPHGRPTIIDFSKNDLEKLFKRIKS